MKYAQKLPESIHSSKHQRVVQVNFQVPDKPTQGKDLHPKKPKSQLHRVFEVQLYSEASAWSGEAMQAHHIAFVLGHCG